MHRHIYSRQQRPKPSVLLLITRWIDVGLTQRLLDPCDTSLSVVSWVSGLIPIKQHLPLTHNRICVHGFARCFYIARREPARKQSRGHQSNFRPVSPLRFSNKTAVRSRMSNRLSIDRFLNRDPMVLSETISERIYTYIYIYIYIYITFLSLSLSLS